VAGMTRIGWLLMAVACVTEDFDGDGYVEPEDCNDNNADQFPGAEEVPYDLIDQDCDGADITDMDGDGFDSDVVGGADCNDFRPGVNPGAEEIPYDGIDQNCDGWSDFDFDRDGYEAQGYGGPDCDDTDPGVVPLDFDGDGFTPCTGDCDDDDPRRFPGNPPVCGNGIEDDCDGVSDCAPTGVVDVVEAPIALVAPAGFVEFGAAMALPGDLSGDGGSDLAVSAIRESDGHALIWIYEGPVASDSSPWATIDVPGDEPGVVAMGDVDDDDLGDLVVTWTADGFDHAALVSGGFGPGTFPLASLALLEVQAPTGDRLDPQVGVLGGETLVFGAARAADGDGRVYLVPIEPSPGPLALGTRGATIEGLPGEGLGFMVEALDVDGDGVDDLVVGGLPDEFSRNQLWFLEGLPTEGTHRVDTLATARIDLPNPWRVPESAIMSDIDADGRADLLLGVPAYERRTGAVVGFTTVPEGEVSVEDAPILIVGLGDQSLGQRIASADHDGDGFLDLAIGAPSIYNEGGDGSATGSVHFFYGPIERVNTVSLEDDWRFFATPDPDVVVRTRLGYQVGFDRLDDDSFVDLATSAPRLGGGVVYVWPGGASAIDGI